MRNTTQLQGVEGYLYQKRASNLSQFENQLTEKLLEKARQKASFIAQSTQNQLKGVLQVSELSDYRDLQKTRSGWIVYPPKSAAPQKIFGEEDEFLLITLKQVLLVRYRVE